MSDRTGHVRDASVRVRKTFVLAIDGGSLSVRWEITNLSGSVLSSSFGTELNLSLLAGNDAGRYLTFEGGDAHHAMDTEGVSEPFSCVELFDQWAKLRVAIEARGATRLLRHAIDTVSQSESGLERTYQGTCFLPVWRLELPPNQTKTIELVLRAGAL
jgi:hypothetical protein